MGYLVPCPSNPLPRITWCTSGPLTFLPLHAAGLYLDANQELNHVFKYAVSSYTPTISALIPALSHSASEQEVGGILAVGQEHSKGHSPLPGTVAELACVKEQSRLVRCTLLEGSKATRKAVLDGMKDHSWIHFACHAMQNAEDATESGFYLDDGLLSLAAITERSFRGKGLAFLSACETATGDRQLPDEAVHLASGMLVTGYRNVIGTMWTIKDQDAPIIAKEVYEALLKDGRMDCTGVARALHEAVARLRATVGYSAFDRWVPYICMGV